MIMLSQAIVTGLTDDLEEAVETWGRTMEFVTQVLGSRQFELLDGKYQYAEVLAKAGRKQEAMRHSKEVKEIRKKVMYSQHEMRKKSIDQFVRIKKGKII